MDVVTRNELRELKEELKDIIRRETIQSIMNIEEAKQTAKILIEAKKLNVGELVRTAVADTVNGKLEALRKEVITLYQKHEEYHRGNEERWGIFKYIANRWERSPFKVMVAMIIFIFLPSIVYIKESRDFVISQIIQLIKLL